MEICYGENEIKMTEEELQWWHGRVNELELKLRSISMDYDKKCEELQQLRNNNKQMKKAQETLNTDLTREKNCGRELDSIVCTLKDTIERQAEQIRQSETQRKCVIRSLSKTRDQLSAEKKKNDEKAAALYLAQKHNNREDLRSKSLIKSLDNFESLQTQMQEEITLEKTKRQNLKVQVRQKLEKVKKEQLLWRHQLEYHHRIVDEWKSKYNSIAQEREVFMAWKGEMTREMEELKRRYTNLSEQKGDLLTELRDAKLTIQDMKKYSQMIEEELVFYKSRVKEENKKFCTEYMASLDSKIQRQNDATTISSDSQHLSKFHPASKECSHRYYFPSNETEFDTQDTEELREDKNEKKKQSRPKSRSGTPQEAKMIQQDKHENEEKQTKLVRNVFSLKTQKKPFILSPSKNRRIDSKDVVLTAHGTPGNISPINPTDDADIAPMEIIQDTNTIQFIPTSLSPRSHRERNSSGGMSESCGSTVYSCGNLFSQRIKETYPHYDSKHSKQTDSVKTVLRHDESASSSSFHKQAASDRIYSQGIWIRPEHAQFFK